jgi:outer membrane protein
MQRSVRIALCSFFLGLAALTVQAAEQPAAAPATTPAQPAFLVPAPGLSLLPAAKESIPPDANTRIGVVDINKVSAESVMGKSAQAQIKGLQARLQKKVEAKRRQLDTFKADAERKLPTMSPAQRDAKSKEFQKKVEEFQKFGANAEKELMAAQEKLTKGLFEAIGETAAALGKAKGLAAVTISRELLYLKAGVEPLDISSDVVKSLNEKNEKK